jgi:hypothetical protein
MIGIITVKHKLRLVLAVALGATTFKLVQLLDLLPYSDTRVAWSDALAMPGHVIGFLVASGGVHGEAPMLWYCSFILGNVAFYGFLWWLVLVGIARLRSRSADAR